MARFRAPVCASLPFALAACAASLAQAQQLEAAPSAPSAPTAPTQSAPSTSLVSTLPGVLAGGVKAGRIVEAFDYSPRLSSSLGFDKAQQRPQRHWSSFGSALDTRGFTSVALGRYGVSSIPLRGTILENTVSLAVAPACGPSPRTNTLQCVNLATGEFLEEFPIPGAVSTQPIFFDGSWFFGTSEGFFVRTESTSLRGTPLLGGENVGLWGSASRRVTRGLRPRTSLDGPEAPTDATAVYRNAARPGWKWFTTSSFEYVGSPVIFGSQVFVLTANQFLLSLDTQSGRSVWSVRLAGETPLRLTASPLTATAKEVLVGTDDGQLLALDPKDGASLWRYLVPARGDERFKGIVAAPLVLGRSVVFSNAESLTTRLSLDGRTVEWTYPVGAVAAPRTDDTTLYLGGNDGSVSALEARSGALKWKVAVSADAPVASVWVLRKKELLLVANKKGAITLLDARRGRALAQTFPVGETVGEFFPGTGEADACLSFTGNGLRCYLAEAVADSLALAGHGR